MTFDVVPLVDVEAPYGAQALRVVNTGNVDFAGPITFTTPAWETVAPFDASGAVRSTDGANTTWTLPAVSIPAGQVALVDLTWTGPFPLDAEVQPLTASTDPARGTITPAGETSVTSPYQLLWIAATPGGQGDTAGTPSFFIGNTTEAPHEGPAAVRLEVWTFPFASVRPVTSNGVTYNGARVAENGTIVGRYDVTLTADARDGRQLFTFANQTAPGTGSVNQQAKQLRYVTTDPERTVAILGSGTVYSPYRP